MSDTSNESGSPPRGERKPVIIDLPAQEVERRPDETLPEGGGESSAMPSEGSRTDMPEVYPETTQAEAAAIRSEADDKVRDSATADEPASAAASATEPSFASQPALPPPPARRRRAGTFAALLLAALLGGALAAGGTALLARQGYLQFAGATPQADAPDYSAEIAALRGEIAALGQAQPTAGPDIAPLQAQVAQLEQAIAQLGRQSGDGASSAPALQEVQNRLAQLEQTTAGAGGQPDPALEARLAELSGQVEQLRGAGGGADPALAGLAGRIDEIAARINDTAGQVQSLQGRPPVDLSGVQSSIAQLGTQVTDLAQRLDGVPTEERVAALEAGLASAQAALNDVSARGDRADALGPAVAAGALVQAVEAGMPFTAELAALRTLGLNAAPLDALQPFAESGLPTLAELRSGFEAAAASVDVSTPVPEDAGAIGRLLESARGLVEVRPANPTGGADPAAVIARMRGALAAGDVRTALNEREALPQDGKAKTEEWARAAQARLAADDLLAQLRAEALSRLGTQG